MNNIQKIIVGIIVTAFFIFLINGLMDQEKERKAREKRWADEKECEEIWKRNNPQSDFDVCQFPNTARAIIRDHRMGIYK